jgi:hypothetical protein
MKTITRTIAAALVLAFAAPAMAANIEAVAPDAGFVSTLTRAAVVIDLIDTIPVAGAEFVAPDAQFVVTKTRAQVAEELAEAASLGAPRSTSLQY